MRPLRLEVDGFTCFRDLQQPLDFSTLSLFAIAGPTGAGKSSVLDAITFALYGYIPRLGKQGVSDAISLGRDRMTVRLDFAVGNRTFRIGRELRRRKPGSVILEELTTGGELFLADKVRDVDEQVAALTGLRYETFIQTVLLPQGDFDRFLRSDSGERGKILRELLNLAVYERMRARAEQDSRQQQQQLKVMRDRLDQDFAGATLENLEKTRAQLGESVALEALTRSAQETSARELQEAVERFSLSNELLVKRDLLKQLDGQQDRIDGDRKKLDLARRAAPVVPVLDALVAAQGRVTIAQAERDAARLAHLAALPELKRREAERQRAVENAKEIPSLRARIQALDELRGVIERRIRLADEMQLASTELETVQRNIRAGEQTLRSATATATGTDRELADAKAARKGFGYDASYHRRLESVLADAIRGRELDRQLAAERRQATAATAKADEAAAEAQESAKTLAGIRSDAAEARRQVQEAAEALEQARLRNHAVALRPTLKVGEPCPVCEQTAKQIPRRIRSIELEDCEEALAKARRAEQKVNGRVDDLRDATASATSLASERRKAATQRLSGIKAIEKEIAALSKKLRGILGRSDDPAIFDTVSEEATRLARLKRKAEALDDRVRAADSAQRTAHHELDKATDSQKNRSLRMTELKTGLGRLQMEESTLLARIVAVTESPDPASERKQLANQVSAHEAAERRADADLQSAQRAFEASASKEANANKALADRESDARLALSMADARLADAKFSDPKAARAAVMSPQAQEALERAIEAHIVARNQTETRVRELEHVLAGRYATEQDRRLAEERASQAQRAHETAVSSVTRLQVEVDRLDSQIVRAESLRRERDELEVQQRLGDRLARDLKSDGFQRYLLEETFKGLVEGASLHFKRWTDNRYTMEWDQGAFYAVDHDSGGERRRAETLSGGETFLASLSLALQLSEEVLRTVGAVQIESLFIDEGFGSLDEGTLEDVIEAIESLRTGGRKIGIITHIRDLAGRLPGRIEIEKRQDGSRWLLTANG